MASEISVTAISDLHGQFPVLAGGDILIVAGDLTSGDTESEYQVFKDWVLAQKYDKKIVIAGNHDRLIQQKKIQFNNPDITYLEDSATSFENISFWGSPWTCSFPGMNKKCNAFTASDRLLSNKWKLIPENIDILITHGPPKGYLDDVMCSGFLESVGSTSLLRAVKKIRPKIHIFGHIHENGGQFTLDFNKKGRWIEFKNVSILNERYKYRGKPTNFVLDRLDFRQAV